MKTITWVVFAGILMTAVCAQNAPPPPAPVRVTAGVSKGMVVTQVRPNYPAEAKAARVQGVVRLEVTVGTGGVVENILLLDGPDLLQQAAVEAVWQWTYRPYLLNGVPVRVVTIVEINFALQ
ncbi:MAG: energy transducer TonB [Acidobacteriota bacterium]